MRDFPFLLAMVLTGLLLSACGGSGDSTPPPVTSSSSSASSSQASSDDDSSSSESSSASSSPPIAGEICGVNSPNVMPANANELPAVKCVVVDQFGYLPEAEKVAVLRSPQEGFDAALEYTPGESLSVVNIGTGESVYSAAPIAWNDGATHAASGDRAWWFDFSSVTVPGDYVVVDNQHLVRSPVFTINANVYRDVLVQATRSFFYQRAGFAKDAAHAGAGWADSASHVGPGQDAEARLYSAPNDASTERDLSGGWYDAGDYNKYTNWHADYLLTLLHMYRESPSVWTDDFNLPESGNGVPDLIDEIKWGMDWLIKMQEDDGSVLSVMDLSHASPPSAASGSSTYGPATTSATLSAAAAFAHGARVFSELPGNPFDAYAADLLNRAEQAWTWAEANPAITFRNSDNGVSAGEQEVDDAGRAVKKRTAAIYLFAATDKASYRDFIDNNVTAINWVGPWNQKELWPQLYYASLDGATSDVANNIRTQYASAMSENWNSQQNDPYRAYLSAQDFTWGSNRTMAYQGLSFYNHKTYELAGADARDSDNIALGYLHYLHGVNPLGKVYLSNMGDYGAEDSVDSFYHSWFSHGSPHWDSVSESSFGPAPGFLVGGPNPSYSWDACCPDSCGGSSNNALCGAAPLSPPADQPPAKSYKDFNDSWPLNSWAVTENHNDYQVAYLLLLSKFVQ